MDFLFFLQGIRSPLLDKIFLFITKFGDESVFLVVGLLIFWCVDKYQGYYLMSVGFAGQVINQILKNLFRIPRPWVLDKNFTAVEAAKERALGYSFPSGHAQMSVGLFGGIAVTYKNIALRVVCCVLCLLIPFSRLYLGVHTPLDVLASMGSAVLLVFGLSPLFSRTRKNPRLLYRFFLLLAVLLACTILCGYIGPLPGAIEPSELDTARKVLWTLLGSTLGLLVSCVIDQQITHFDTSASLLVQVIKFVLGMAITLGVKEGLKPVLNLIPGDYAVKYAIRYFAVVAAACGLWPMTFRCLSKITPQKADK